MNEEDGGGLAEESFKDGSLQDPMAHWAAVLDRWVSRVDLGMGARVAGNNGQGGAGGNDPMSSSDGGSDLPKTLGVS